MQNCKTWWKFEKRWRSNSTFQINNVKLYVSVVTLLINDDIEFLENLKQWFKRTISWEQIWIWNNTTKKKNNLDYLIDPTFRIINRLFVLSFKNSDNDATSYSFDKYYIQLVEIKDFIVLIDNKPFFDQPAKNKQEAHEKHLQISRNNNYLTGNLLDYFYHQKRICLSW